MFDMGSYTELFTGSAATGIIAVESFPPVYFFALPCSLLFLSALYTATSMALWSLKLILNFCVENLRNSLLIRAIFALNLKVLDHNLLRPE